MCFLARACTQQYVHPLSCRWSSSPIAFTPHSSRAVTPGSPTSQLLSKCCASTNSSWWVYLSEVICCKWTKPAGVSTTNPINSGRWPFGLWSLVPGPWPHSAQLNYGPLSLTLTLVVAFYRRNSLNPPGSLAVWAAAASSMFLTLDTLVHWWASTVIGWLSSALVGLQ